MKKFIVLSLVLGMLASTGVVFAEGTDTSATADTPAVTDTQKQFRGKHGNHGMYGKYDKHGSDDATDDTTDEATDKVTDREKPVQQHNHSLAPTRVLTDKLGATVDYDEDTKTITITKDDNVIVMQIDSTTATVNGEEQTLETAPAILRDRVMVPIQFIADTLGVDLDAMHNKPVAPQADKTTETTTETAA